jgi:hypothetical protein
MTFVSQLWDALSYAVTTSLAVLGLCVVAVVLVAWAVRR